MPSATPPAAGRDRCAVRVAARWSAPPLACTVLLFATYASTWFLIVLTEADPATATPAAESPPAPTPMAPPMVSR